MLHEAGIVADRMMVELRTALVGKPDYLGEVASRFDRLLFLLVKFIEHRINGQGASYPYLKRMENGITPHESELQDDLWVFLTGNGYPTAEKTDVNAGRADIYIPQRGFRFLIEVKRLQEAWTESALAPSYGKPEPIIRPT